MHGEGIGTQGHDRNRTGSTTHNPWYYTTTKFNVGCCHCYRLSGRASQCTIKLSLQTILSQTRGGGNMAQQHTQNDTQTHTQVTGVTSSNQQPTPSVKNAVPMRSTLRYHSIFCSTSSDDSISRGRHREICAKLQQGGYQVVPAGVRHLLAVSTRSGQFWWKTRHKVTGSENKGRTLHDGVAMQQQWYC
jgi:hypothetical protein